MTFKNFILSWRTKLKRILVIILKYICKVKLPAIGLVVRKKKKMKDGVTVKYLARKIILL